MKQLWLDSVTKRPILVIVICLLAIVASSYGAKNLVFNGDYKVFFEKDNPQRVAFENMQSIYTKNETASIVITNKDGSVFNPTSLKLIADMTEEAWQTPLSSRIDSLTNFQHTWSEDDDLVVEQLVRDADSISNDEIQRIKNIALQEPNLVDRLVSKSGEAAIISITVLLPDGDKSAANAEISHFIWDMTEKYKAIYPNHEFYHSGLVFMNVAFETEAKKDAQTLVPLMFLVIILLLWVLLRTLLGTVATTLVVITSIATTMGVSGWLGFTLTTATVNVPTLVMTLAVADCVHVVASMLYEMRKGTSKSESIITSMELNLKPIFITSATTSVGFLTLNFSNVPALADLGTLTAIGVMIAFVLSVTLLPALLTLLPIKAQQKKTNSADKFVTFGDWVIRHHKRILPFTLVLVLASIGATFLNKINDIPIEYFDEANDFKMAADFQNQVMGGMTMIDFALDTKVESGINDPKNLADIHEFSLWLKSQPEVDHVSSITDTFLRLNKNMHGDDESYYRLPDSQELSAQFLLLYEMSLPFNLDVNNQLNMDKSGTRISVTMQNLGSKEVTEFEKRAFDWVESNMPNLEMTSGSQNLMFAHIGEANMNSMLKGTFLALILISLILILALKSWQMGIISLIPNILPAGIGFGIWGIYSGEINMATSVVSSMALGIIVDDTVHFLSKYRHARISGSNAEESVRYAFRSVGRALWITTVVLTIGFSMLTLSTFAMNSDMGLLVGIIIVVALAIDFLFLPAFLLMFDKKDFNGGTNSEHKQVANANL